MYRGATLEQGGSEIQGIPILLDRVMYQSVSDRRVFASVFSRHIITDEQRYRSKEEMGFECISIILDRVMYQSVSDRRVFACVFSPYIIDSVVFKGCTRALVTDESSPVSFRRASSIWRSLAFLSLVRVKYDGLWHVSTRAAPW